MRKPGQCQNDDSLKRGNRRAAEAFPDKRSPTLTCATSISRGIPNSRSQAIDAAAKMAVNATDLDRTPG